MKNPSVATAAYAAVILSLAACGSDSTGPGNLDAHSAVQSLSIGLAGLSGIQSPDAATFAGSLGNMEPLLDQVSVDIGGTTRSMFALGMRQSFPTGTCVEDVFVDPSVPPDPAVCTPLSLGVVLVFWQSHAASAPPDRLLVVLADQGTSDFSFLSDVAGEVPGLAIYLEGNNIDNAWFSDAGTLTTNVASTGAGCTIPLPPYAKSATCSIATFQESGGLTFENLNDATTTSASLAVTIPTSTLHGIWEAITETQPVIITAGAVSALRTHALAYGLVKGLGRLGR
ncbi:MAG: hypothetical protein ACRENK_14570 [Gemmatimonadaceae bacterium]